MSNIITIANVSIRQDDQGRYSLNDLHRAAGEEVRHRPGIWVQNQQTKDLAAEIEKDGIPSIQAKQGLGTFVCKELVYAYAMWISPAFHLKVIRAYDQMQIAQQPTALSRMEILQLAMESEQARIKAETERDEAVRTKALIGSKREAQAMATASKAVREANKLREELGRNQSHATIIAVEQVTGMKFPRNAYVGLRRWCKTNGVSPATVMDERYGMVKAWPAGAWLDQYDIDLGLLFGEPRVAPGGVAVAVR